MDSLHILSLNVCGLVRRLQYPEFSDLISGYDILCLTESKTDSLDNIEINGFEVRMKNRSRVSNVKSGGITLAYKCSLSDFVSEVENDCQYVKWFKIDKMGIHSDQDILLGIVYIPPEGSSYCVGNPFEELEQEYLRLSNTYQNICLLGDFNARTATEKDFIEIDALSRNDDLFHEIIESNFDYSVFNEMSIPIQRYSKDKSKNNFGNRLVELCKYHDLFIFNGRVGEDRGVGELTCKASSVVDYVIGSASVLKHVQNFSILEFSKLYSDAHNPLSLCLCFKANATPVIVNCNKNIGEKIKKWDCEKAHSFTQNLDKVKTRQLLADLRNLEKENGEINVNGCMDKTCEIILDAAKVTFGTYVPNFKTSVSKNNKPWFNIECKLARKSFRQCKAKYRKQKNDMFFNRYKEAEKNYKRTMDCSIKKYRSELRKKLDGYRSNNPKEYWKLINNCNRSKPNSKISIDILYEYFKNANNDDENNSTFTANSTDRGNHIINRKITKEEIETALRKLKNNKACGEDFIFNEYIKHSSPVMVDLYVEIFNMIFDSGQIPEKWLAGDIIPIYKGKGSQQEPQNYRPITILSCFGKLFTGILNDRLQKYSDEFNIILENQCGFRKGYSTVDNIFVLHTLYSLLKCKKKKMYCVFIDFAKAFDNISRNGLWSKMSVNNITGKMFQIIFNMYQGIKSRVSFNNDKSPYFPCNIGVRQGENLSPFLFSLYLNDLEEFMSANDITGLASVAEDFEDNLNIYIKMFLMLYADDTLLFSESAEDMQRQLDCFKTYCDHWKLKVNVSKSKAMVFASRRQNNVLFMFDNAPLTIVDDFNYLGVTFSRTSSFAKTLQINAAKANAAMYNILKKGRQLNLSLKCQYDLFEKIVKPILLYGCEVWGFVKLDILERVHLKFCKLLLNLKQSTPSYMVYGELGAYPLYVSVKARMIGYWSKLIDTECTKFSSILYQLLYHKHTFYSLNSSWINCMKSILDQCGLSYIWLSQNTVSNHLLSKHVKCILSEQFKQNWRSDVLNSPKASCYRIFKTEHCFENYLDFLNDKNIKVFCKFRTCNNKLPVEIGRWLNINREDRICNHCNKNTVGDEFHYVLECPFFMNERKTLLGNYFCKNVNVIKFEQLMTCKNHRKLKNLCIFIKHIIDVVCPPT